MVQALKADTYRQFAAFSWSKFIRGFLSRRTFRVVATMRLCQIAATARGGARVLKLPLKLLHRIATHQAAMDLPWEIQCGPGLAIVHGWGLVISPGADLGSNVTLFHGVTLGQRDRIAPDGSRQVGCPTLEDEVWVGPNATVVGGIRIGRGSRIAAGAFVTTDIPPYSLVIGNPAAVVKSGCTPDVMNPAPL